MYDKNGLKMYDYGDKTNAGLERPAFTKSNALSDAILDTREGNGNSFSGSVFAEIRFLKDFKFTSTNDVYVEDVYKRQELYHLENNMNRIHNTLFYYYHLG